MIWTRPGKPTNCNDERLMEGLGTSERALVDGQRRGGGGTARRARAGMRGLGATRGNAYLAQLNIRLTEDDLTELHNACLRLKTSASAFARVAIRTQMASMEADTK
jgi:hypothetical protein